MNKAITKSSNTRNKDIEKTSLMACIYFLDVASGQVRSANSDGSDLKTVVEEGRKLPDGLVVDSAAGHLY